MSIERIAPASVTTPEPPTVERDAAAAAPGIETVAGTVLALVGLDPVAALITLDVVNGER